MMKSIIEISRINWENLRVAPGSAVIIPNALIRLLKTQSAEDANEIYWQLENHIVIQGQVFQCAEFAIPVLLLALADDCSRPTKVACMELLFQILAGTPHQSEIDAENNELMDRCHKKAREGLWLLYKELQDGVTDAAYEILDLIDDDKERLNFYANNKKHD
ncbi:hypothetical protein V8J88_23925 [Massilia sp. W12]|uniref:hypothetical protein n=1 Tax=Massilia sp. W12 TaxID=3126507 RepID=UPI0030CBFCA3